MKSTTQVKLQRAGICLFLSVAAGLASIVGAVSISAKQGDPKPAPEMAVLKGAEGSWDATISMQGMPAKGTSSGKIGLGGFWLVEEFNGNLGGMTFSGRGLTSYDPGKKKYVNIWIDSMGPQHMVTEGTYDSATKTLTLKGDMPMPDGTTTKVTLTTVTKDADTRVFSMKVPGSDGKDAEMMSVTYKRRKGR